MRTTSEVTTKLQLAKAHHATIRASDLFRSIPSRRLPPPHHFLSNRVHSIAPAAPAASFPLQSGPFHRASCPRPIISSPNGVQRHFWDGWHLVKWFGNNLRKEAKNKGCVPLSVWYKKLKTHMWTAIEVGEGERIRHIFNMCLKHVQDVHAWPKDEITGKFTRCGHPPLEGPRPETITEGTPAFDRLSHLVLNKNLQKDLAKASPRGGTSISNPLFTYKLYTMLSTMHFNTLRLAEMAGERRVQRVIEVQRKYFRRTSRMVFKTPVEHLWRDQIAQAVLDARREHHELPPEDVDSRG
ncbi:hypothetical protein ANCDUO_09729 [Ancylostoma duodenale]|uniref:Uncharacterized protein n=1 Tax=Ancylostoma duodenale TaxID=51022 RepID=A0A0C2CT20_9BILA|nr:hypothetical protein ANCDUO_09729 [Ancylostoma duodenale]